MNKPDYLQGLCTALWLWGVIAMAAAAALSLTSAHPMALEEMGKADSQ